MFNIKKQIKLLYTSSIFGQLSLSGAWVAILSARGFSLTQIGLAETIFHLVSLIFEIPSGIIADIFGRKKTLLFSCLMRITANLVMIFSKNFGLVCLSFVFEALHYNFLSGSDDALAYDSLKSQGQENKFEKYSSNQFIIYRACEGISTLMAGFSLMIGYKMSYSISLVFALIQLHLIYGLKEINISSSDKKYEKNSLKNFLFYFTQSIVFLKRQKKAFILMLTNSFAGAMDVLLLFFLQAKLPMAGIPEWALGIALLIMQAGGIVGARIILLAKKLPYSITFILSSFIIILGIILEHTAIYTLMTAGGFLAAMADDALQVKTNTTLQDMFPSEQRATLTSIESFSFSIIMIVLSPLAGLFFKFW